MLFLLFYHFSVQQNRVLPENVRGNSGLKDYYGKLWETKTAEQDRTSMHSFQMCFQSSSEDQICIAFGGAT